MAPGVELRDGAIDFYFDHSSEIRVDLFAVRGSDCWMRRCKTTDETRVLAALSFYCCPCTGGEGDSGLRFCCVLLDRDFGAAGDTPFAWEKV